MLAPTTSTPRVIEHTRRLADIARRARGGHWFGRDIEAYRRAARAEGVEPDEEALQTLRRTYYETVYEGTLSQIESTAGGGRWHKTEVARYLDAARALGRRPDGARLQQAWETYFDRGQPQGADRDTPAVPRGYVAAGSNQQAPPGVGRRLGLLMDSLAGRSPEKTRAAERLLLKIQSFAGQGQWSDQRVQAYRDAAHAAGLDVNDDALSRARAGAGARSERLLRTLEAKADAGWYVPDEIAAYRDAARRAGLEADEPRLKRASLRHQTWRAFNALRTQAGEGLWRDKVVSAYASSCEKVGLSSNEGIDEARALYLDALLREVETSAAEGDWPEWKLDTYERACREHDVPVDGDRLMAAKRACIDRALDSLALYVHTDVWSTAEVEKIEGLGVKLGIAVAADIAAARALHRDHWIVAAERAAKAGKCVHEELQKYRERVFELDESADTERIERVWDARIAFNMEQAMAAARSGDATDVDAWLRSLRADTKYAGRAEPDDEAITPVRTAFVSAAAEQAEALARQGEALYRCLQTYREACSHFDIEADAKVLAGIESQRTNWGLEEATRAADAGEDVERALADHVQIAGEVGADSNDDAMRRIRRRGRKRLSAVIGAAVGEGTWPVDAVERFEELSEVLRVDSARATRAWRKTLAGTIRSVVERDAAAGRWTLGAFEEAARQAGLELDQPWIGEARQSHLDAMIEDVKRKADGGDNPAEAIEQLRRELGEHGLRLDEEEEQSVAAAKAAYAEAVLARAESLAADAQRVDELMAALDAYKKEMPDDEGSRYLALNRACCRNVLVRITEAAESCEWDDDNVTRYHDVCKESGLPPDAEGLNKARRVYAEALMDRVEQHALAGEWLTDVIDEHDAVCKELEIPSASNRRSTSVVSFREHETTGIEHDAAAGTWDDDRVGRLNDVMAAEGVGLDATRLAAAWRLYLAGGGDTDRKTAPTPIPTSPAAAEAEELLATLESEAEDGTWPGAVFMKYLDACQAAAQAPDTDRTLGAWETYVTAGGAIVADAQLLALMEHKKVGLADELMSTQPPAEGDDTALLRRALLALDHKMLTELSEAGYTITVTRHRLSNADKTLQTAGVVDQYGNPIPVDLAEGVHRSGNGQQPGITIRTYWRNGSLQLDASTLLHEIGHAYDLVLRARGSTADHANQDLADAFAAEHKRFVDPYFHTQPEFVAEVTAYYLLDPERCEREFPNTYAALDQRYSRYITDRGRLASLQRDQTGRGIVNVADDPCGRVAHLENMNLVRDREGMPRQPYIVLLKGSRDVGSAELAQDMANAVRLTRSPERPQFRNNESLVRVDAATFNSPENLKIVLDRQLTSDRGALLFVDELANIQPDSPGFELIDAYYQRLGGFIPLVFAGEASALKKVENALPSVPRYGFELEPLSEQQTATFVDRMARNEGFYLDDAARRAVVERSDGGGRAAAETLWQQIKKAQTERVGRSADGHTIAAMRRITAADVHGAEVAAVRDPLVEADRMIGQDTVKTMLRTLMQQAQQAKRQEELGLTSKRPRLNLLFSGNPGTGKTTWADLFVEALHSIGYLKRKTIARRTIQDLVAGNPEDNVKRLFEENKDGAIFVDEMHQLHDTKEGQRAFRAMIPYLADKAYQDTVFIGGGYPEELLDLLREVDAGAERRFRTVPFDDFTDDELQAILHKMAGDQDITLDAKSEAAALSRIARERRKMKYFGNAGTVETVLDAALHRRTERLSQSDVATLTADAFQKLAPEDFEDVLPCTLEEVWQKLDALDGLDDVKAKLKRIEALVSFARDQGRDPLDFFEPYFIFQGPPGTGKTTVARLLGQFFAALDLIPMAEVKEYGGGDLQAGFVGQTKGVVRKMFENAWGRVLFLDEASALAKAGGTFKEEAAKEMLKQLEDHRGRFVMVAADYEENINAFLLMDPGLPRRFGNRVDFSAMTAHDAAAALTRQLGSQSFDTTDVAGVLVQHMERLRELPGWASGGDVRKLVNLVVQHQALAFAASGATDGARLLPAAVQDAFTELRREKQMLAAAQPQKDSDAHLYATEVKAAVQKPDEEEEAEPLTPGDRRVLAAIANADQQFARYFDQKGPSAQAAAETNPDSAYMQLIASELGVEADEAVKQVAATKVKVKRWVTVEKKIERFVYHCPYCGGVEAPSCAYINQPLDWKIQHSMVKPWTEVETERKLVEEEI